MNNVQLTRNRALRICVRKHRWSCQKLQEEANIPAVMYIQIKLANGYLKSGKENKIESKLELIQKKRQGPKNSYQITLDHLSC